MGTRNLTKVIDANGEIVVAQYGQWDGYPSGQGINALLHAYNYRQIENKLGNVHFLTNEEMDNINSILSATDKPIGELYPTLSRDTCADILGYVAWATERIPLVDSRDFENDELFCEAVYTLNFQTKEFISTYGGHTLIHRLDELPEPKEYLGEWAVTLDPGVVDA
jgi:hypothetical protein